MEGSTLHPILLFKDAFVSITKDVGFHISHDQTHDFLLPFQFSRQQVQIVFSIDGIHIQANVTIIDPIWMDLILLVIIINEWMW